jgi:MFS transporter, MHS family, proline/betaine transporter
MRLSASGKALLAGTSGTALQWYDFAIFGYFAPMIAATFFPKGNAVAALLSAFGVFAVGYLLAPLGSLVFGYIGDRYGRKRALTLSILGMAIPTATISVLPGYQTLGLFAPILVTLLRVTQGFVASSEFTGSAIFLVEHAKPKQKAFYGCLTSISYSTGVLFAGLITTLLTASFMPSWAWRLGFAFALIAGLVIFYLRLHVPETPIYQALDQKDKPRMPCLTAIKTVPFAFLGVIGLAWLIGMMTFGTYVFAASYLHVYMKLSLSTATLITTLALLVDVLVEPLIAILSDKIGHVRVMITGIILMLLLSFPVFYCLASGHLTLIITGMMVMSGLIAIAFAPINAYMVELFPKSCRYSGFGVAFHLGISLFGGTTPLVLMWIVEKTGNLVAPAYYYVWGACIGLASLMLCEYSRRRVTSRVVVELTNPTTV